MKDLNRSIVLDVETAGRDGTLRELAAFGKRLIRVRWRKHHSGRRFKTVELAPKDYPGPGVALASVFASRRLNPGKPGAMAETREHGDRLVCCRYRRDENGKTWKTVEIQVASSKDIRHAIDHWLYIR